MRYFFVNYNYIIHMRILLKNILGGSVKEDSVLFAGMDHAILCAVS